MKGRETLYLVLSLKFIGLVLVAAQGSNLFNDPCWHKSCHYYANCVKNNGAAVCVCPQNCSKERVPVCGTDWKTYDNICQLMAKSCKNDGLTRLRYQGECAAGSCRTTRWESALRCPYFSQCFLSYGLPRCACPKEECPAVYEPVCGTDEKTYRNVCFLRKAACKAKMWVGVRKMGHCLPDPCSFMNCCCGAVCRVNTTNQASCHCRFDCTQQYVPVCGSDGKTYNNVCNLLSAACVLQDSKLVVASSRGPCPTVAPVITPSPCELIKCAFYATCQVFGGKHAMCVCPSSCEHRVPNPVCGDNGVTYQNECELKKASCTNRTTIGIARYGVCVTIAPTTASPCSTVQCHKHATCAVVGGIARCLCPNNCSTEGTPVCGSDDVTYTNECHLNKTSCENSKNTTLVKMEACSPTQPTPTASPCALIQCLFHSTCVVKQSKGQSFATCDCPTNCSSGGAKVCGSDDVTYDNECLLKRKACLTSTNITVAKKEPCVAPPPTQPPIVDPCTNITCQNYAKCKVINGEARCVCPNDCMRTSANIPVCGSDGVTYKSECDLRRESCRQQKTVKYVEMGICDAVITACNNEKCGYNATCRVDHDGVARCVCPGPCSKTYDPVCDQNRINYRNECELKVKSCQTKKELRVTEKGLCESELCPVPKKCFAFCKSPAWIAGRFACPPDPLFCLNDHECTGGKICCRDGCTRKCLLPTKEIL